VFLKKVPRYKKKQKHTILLLYILGPEMEEGKLREEETLLLSDMLFDDHRIVSPEEETNEQKERREDREALLLVFLVVARAPIVLVWCTLYRVYDWIWLSQQKKEPSRANRRRQLFIRFLCQHPVPLFGLFCVYITLFLCMMIVAVWVVFPYISREIHLNCLFPVNLEEFLLLRRNVFLVAAGFFTVAIACAGWEIARLYIDPSRYHDARARAARLYRGTSCRDVRITFMFLLLIQLIVCLVMGGTFMALIVSTSESDGAISCFFTR